ncbi:uncharacterized protein [Amphiura filiformis]|uniref:uncharacterized protein n=1 Tax=Amphiura filiformis TaxID=82378 RepID=UPI003B215909
MTDPRRRQVPQTETGLCHKAPRVRGCLDVISEEAVPHVDGKNAPQEIAETAHGRETNIYMIYRNLYRWNPTLVAINEEETPAKTPGVIEAVPTIDNNDATFNRAVTPKHKIDMSGETSSERLRIHDEQIDDDDDMENVMALGMTMETLAVNSTLDNAEIVVTPISVTDICVVIGMSMISALTIFGNVVTIGTVLIIHYGGRSHVLDSLKKNFLYHVYIVSLSVGDLVSGVLMIISVYMSTFNFATTSQGSMCRVLRFFIELTTSVSQLQLTAISIDRLYAVVKPLPGITTISQQGCRLKRQRRIQRQRHLFIDSRFIGRLLVYQIRRSLRFTMQSFICSVLALGFILCFNNYLVLCVNPGFKARLTQKGVDYLRDVGINILKSELSSLRIPDMSGTEHIGGVGKVDYTVSNMRFKSLGIPSPSLLPNPTIGGVELTANGVSLSLSGDWKYKAKVAFIPVKDHGTFDVSASGISLRLAIRIGVDSFGRPTISSRDSDCSFGLGSLHVKFHGGASWIYNLFDDAIESSLKKSIRNEACKEILKEVNDDLSKEVAKLKVVAKIDNIAEIDYSLVSPPNFQGAINMENKGEVFPIGKRDEAPFPVPLIPDDPDTSHMLEIWITEFLLESAGYVYYSAHSLQHIRPIERIINDIWFPEGSVLVNFDDEMQYVTSVSSNRKLLRQVPIVAE